MEQANMADIYPIRHRIETQIRSGCVLEKTQISVISNWYLVVSQPQEEANSNWQLAIGKGKNQPQNQNPPHKATAEGGCATRSILGVRR